MLNRLDCLTSLIAPSSVTDILDRLDCLISFINPNSVADRLNSFIARNGVTGKLMF